MGGRKLFFLRGGDPTREEGKGGEKREDVGMEVKCVFWGLEKGIEK